VIETAPRPTIRTIVASFLFTDLVGFSKGTAAEQYAAKARLSAALRGHLAPLSQTDYWIKDTGDGALIAFVSNPEHALYMALALAHDYGRGEDPNVEPSTLLRTGLHLGTVKESVDVEARRNFIGDGINAAKRIMDFALPGRIAASRAFFEAIANLDAAYAALFRHAGSPDDKHGRSHELYELAPSDTVLEKLRSEIAAERGGAPGSSASASASDPARAVRSGSARYRRYATFVGIALALAIAAVAMREAPRLGAAPEASSSVAPGEPRPATRAGAQPSVAAPSAASALRPEEPPPVPEASVPPASRPDSARPIDRSEANSGATHTQTGAPPQPTRATSERTRSATRPAADAAANVSNPRCSRIVEKAALGEPLTPDEKKELATTCR